MRRLGRLISLFGILSTAAILSRCQYIGGFAGNEIVDPGQGGSGGQGGSDDACALVQEPAAPTAGTPSDDDVPFTLAVRSIELDEGVNKAIGLDVDGACTCNADESCACATVETCQRPPIVAADEWQNCDLPGGVDANSRSLFSVVQSFAPLLSSSVVSSAMMLGGGSVLFDVRQYNGQPNDPSVIVGVYTAGPFLSAECNTSAPMWQGEDAWPILNQSVLAPLPTCGALPSPTVFDAFGYVTDNHLVTHLDEVTFALQLGVSVLDFTVSDTTVVIPLQQDAEGRWRTEGAVLAGHWQLDDVFRALGALNELTELDLCGPGLASAQSTACALADTATHNQPGDTCDAVSFALEFNAQEARFGNTIDLPPINICRELLMLDCETPLR